MRKSHRSASDIQQILESLASPIRLRILKSLAYQKLGYSELARPAEMDGQGDPGNSPTHPKGPPK
ncbi:MAG: hypothetical protein J7L17_01715, partial [Thaumarchaeota archaeon]|nr:hypothetical protein [Nitrososphaerota archaeon]